MQGIPSLVLLSNNPEAAACFPSQQLVTEVYGAQGPKSLELAMRWEQACNAQKRLPVSCPVAARFLKAKPELNGQEGKVVGYKYAGGEDLNQATNLRYIVQLGETEMALKRANLMPLNVGSWGMSETLIRWDFFMTRRTSREQDTPWPAT